MRLLVVAPLVVLLFVLPLASAEPLAGTAFTGLRYYSGVATQDSMDGWKEWDLRGGGVPCERGGVTATATLTVLAGAADDVVRLHVDGEVAEAAPGTSVTLSSHTCAYFSVEGASVAAAAPYVVEVTFLY